MRVFVDTSALFALLDADQPGHPAADACWRELLEGETQLLTSNYVLLETTALSQSRLGIEAVRDLQHTMVPLLDVVWIDEELHAAALTALLAAGRRSLSLVDWSSFEAMQRRAIRRAFAFDADFSDQGFEVIPSRTPGRS